MKKKLVVNLGILMFIIFMASSCLNSDDPEVNIRTEAEELNLIEYYIKSLGDMGYDVDTTATGVYYVTVEEGEGPLPEDGDTLSIGFAGYLIDEAIFDSSEALNTSGQQELVLGEDDTIQGWTDGLKHVRKNGKIHFIVPSRLAYGSVGQGKIGPYQTLVFVVKLFDLKKTGEQ
jgi:FKBP-type peptidyl-prolyl cis-trans isomerase